MSLKRPCLTCGIPTHGGRCQAHRTRTYDPRTMEEKGLGKAHRRSAKQVLVDEHRCWICGGNPTPSDPLEADHIIPRSKGGTSARSNYHAAHRSCNRARGNRMLVPTPSNLAIR